MTFDAIRTIQIPGFCRRRKAQSKIKEKKVTLKLNSQSVSAFPSLRASQGHACKLTSCGRLSLHVHLDQLANWLQLKPAVAFGMTGLLSIFRRVQLMPPSFDQTQQKSWAHQTNKKKEKKLLHAIFKASFCPRRQYRGLLNSVGSVPLEGRRGSGGAAGGWKGAEGWTSQNRALRIAAVHKGTSDPYLQWPTFNWTQTLSEKVDPWVTLVDTSKNSGINFAPGKTAKGRRLAGKTCASRNPSNTLPLILLNAT